jgi:hypothetical protein
MATAPSFQLDPIVEFRFQVLIACNGDVVRAKQAWDFITEDENVVAIRSAGDVAPAKTRATRKAKAEEPEPEIQKLPEEQAAEAIGAPGTSYDDVRQAIIQLGIKKGSDTVRKVLASFGVDHGSKLTEAQWPEAIAALDREG